MSMNRTWAISSWISFLISVDISRMRVGIEHERYGKTERHCGDKDRQNPLWPVVIGHDCRADLDGEPGLPRRSRTRRDKPSVVLTHGRTSSSWSVAYVVSAIQGTTSSMNQLRQVSRLLT